MKPAPWRVRQVASGPFPDGKARHAPSLSGASLPAALLGIVVLFYLTDEPKDAKWLRADQRQWQHIVCLGDGPIRQHGATALREEAGHLVDEARAVEPRAQFVGGPA